MKCKKCGRTYPGDAKGKFPKNYFKHRAKYHARAMKRGRKGGRRGSSRKSHGKGKSSTVGTGGYSKLTLTFHD